MNSHQKVINYMKATLTLKCLKAKYHNFSKKKRI